MPASPLRLTISNIATGRDYALMVKIGARETPAALMLDTGSAMLAVSRAAYDPTTDPAAVTTQMLQMANYLSGSFAGAVVRTSLHLDQAAGGSMTLPGVNLAVTYDARTTLFDHADGVFGLAYSKLDTALLMPADTWSNQYDASQIGLGRACDVAPCFDQLAEAGVAADIFAFSVRRALKRQALEDPEQDPLNTGLFIIGGGAECHDLYDPPFVEIAIAAADYFNVTLLSLRVGDGTLIPVPGVAAGGAALSSAIIDSGNSALTLDQDVYDAVIAAFTAIQPAFGSALAEAAIFGGGDIAQDGLDLEAWPLLTLTFAGVAGAPVAVTIAPGDYWQCDAAGAGRAIAALCGDSGMLGGQSNLGLPLFAGHFVVFDRSRSSGNGVVAIARRPG